MPLGFIKGGEFSLAMIGQPQIKTLSYFVGCTDSILFHVSIVDDIKSDVTSTLHRNIYN
jgi:hypothetical protein